MQDPENAYYQGKQANLEELHVLHFNQMTFWKRQNCGDRKKISGCQQLRGTGGRVSEQ